MKTEIILTRLKARAVEWLVTTGDKVMAGGICATFRDAANDAGIWCTDNGCEVLATRRVRK